MKIKKSINGVQFLDFAKLLKSIENEQIENKLLKFIENSGAKFYLKNKRFIKKPSVSVIGIGGLPFEISQQPNLIKKQISGTESMMGFGGACSYLNPNNQSPIKLLKIMHGKGHFSTGHMISINLLISGVSTGVENEFNSQRDIVHLARLTVSRTKSQSRPPIVVLYPKLLKLYEKIIDEIESNYINQSSPTKDLLEAQNLVFPTAKATFFIMTTDLKNLQKLVQFLDDDGKEEEFKRVVYMIVENISKLWPEMFQNIYKYRYKIPKHLNNNRI